MASSPPQALPAGRLFGGRWRIVRCIRAGGMGAVYEVVHRETQARCALKVMRPELVTSAEMRARFRQEAMVTATIESDHIVKVFDGGTDPETSAPYLVMELLRGEDLAARVAARGALPPAEAVALLRQAAPALERTHAAGVVHRDLKPDNLFVTTRDDGSPCLKVLDFGIAKMIASASRAETTRTVGTPLYMAPEQVKGDGAIAAPADLYALGQIAYTLLVGQAYWTEEQAAGKNVYPVLMAITAGTAEPASARAARAGATLPEAFDAWFARATAGPPGERFGGAREMVDALATALGVAAPTAYVEAQPAPSAASRGSGAPGARPLTVGGVSRDAPAAARSRVITLAGALVIVAAGALAWSMRSGSPGPAPAAIASAPAPPSEDETPAAAPTASATASAATASAATASAATASAATASGAPLPTALRTRPAASVKPPPPTPATSPSDPSDVYRREHTP